MKKDEKKFLDNFSKSKSEKLNFNEVFLEAGMNEFKSEEGSKFKNINKKAIIGISLCSFLVIGVSIGLLTYFLTPKIKSIEIANRNNLVTEYEINSSLVLDNLLVNKTYNDDKKEVLSFSDMRIDTSGFQNEPGEYSINIFLKDDMNFNASYIVTVIDDYLEKIEVDETKTRKIYFEGETIKQDEIEIIKHRKNNDGVANINDIKILEEEPLTLGKEKTITTSLKSNTTFSDTYKIEVLPLSDLNINTKFYRVDDSDTTYHPSILALEIKENIYCSYHSDILLDGPAIFEVLDGNIILKGIKTKQSAIYNPFLGTLKVDGLTIGEEPYYLFALDENDKILTIESDDIPRTNFVALDGKVDDETLKYFDEVLGGVYLDKEGKNRITSETKINNDSSIYLYINDEPMVDAKFLGKFTCDDKAIDYDIGEEDIRSFKNKKRYSYYVRSDKYNRPILEKASGSQTDTIKLVYDETIDSLIKVNGEEILETYHRYNPTNKVLVTLIDKFNCYEMIHEKGFKYNKNYPYEIFDDQVLFIDQLDNSLAFEPIIEDITFTNLSFSYNYMSDLDGVYGTYDDFFEIATNWGIGLPSINHRMVYCYRLNKNLKEIEKGYVYFEDIKIYSESKRTFTLKLVNEKQEVSYIDVNWNVHLPSLKIKEASIDDRILKYENPDFLKDLPIIGTYEDDSKNLIEVEPEGRISTKKQTSSGQVTIKYLYFFVKEVNESKIVAYYNYQNMDDEKEEVILTFVKNKEGNFEFDYLGKHFVQI